METQREVFCFLLGVVVGVGALTAVVVPWIKRNLRR